MPKGASSALFPLDFIPPLLCVRGKPRGININLAFEEIIFYYCKLPSQHSNQTIRIFISCSHTNNLAPHNINARIQVDVCTEAVLAAQLSKDVFYMFFVILLFAMFASLFTLQKETLEYCEPFFLIGSRMLFAGIILLIKNQPKASLVFPITCIICRIFNQHL